MRLPIEQVCAEAFGVSMPADLGRRMTNARVRLSRDARRRIDVRT